VTNSGEFLLASIPDDCGVWRARLTNLLLSFLAHGLGVVVLIALAGYVARRPGKFGEQIHAIGSGPISFPFASEKGGGHGGGGDHDTQAASHGALPRMTLQDQLTPPEAILHNPDPKLPEPPSVMSLSVVPLPQLGQLGDPLALEGPPTNGPGGGGGIGSGCCGGVGPNIGPGFGPYDSGNIFRPGVGEVTAPRAIYTPDPDYSDQARKAKCQGAVLLWLVVGADGHPRDIRVQRSPGMGLDEKAVEAVRQWRFQPATLNGRPVAVQINVEMSFRLY
jgi:protein TonB